jgi:hypothetical protein
LATEVRRAAASAQSPPLGDAVAGAVDTDVEVPELAPADGWLPPVQAESATARLPTTIASFRDASLVWITGCIALRLPPL